MSDFINILNTIKLFFLSLFETGKQEKENFLKLSQWFTFLEWSKIICEREILIFD